MKRLFGSLQIVIRGAAIVVAALVLIGFLYLSNNFTSQASGEYRMGGEVRDQPTTVTSYYLHKINGVNSAVNIPLFLRQADNDLQTYNETTFGTYLKEWMKKTAADSSDGFKIVSIFSNTFSVLF